MLANKNTLPAGWASRILIQCGVRFAEIWDIFNEMYESQVRIYLWASHFSEYRLTRKLKVPPFNDQANVQAISSEIASLITDWLAEATRPQANLLRSEFPAGRIDSALDQYLSELEPSRVETKTRYENAKRLVRQYW